MLTPDLIAQAEALIRAFAPSGIMVATAESCTGGLVAGALTAVAGSSAVVERGFVTYSNEAKADMLGVPESLIETHGAVSESVARAMAIGALARSRAAVSVSVTGIAGPGGGSEAKPVGLVHFACAAKEGRVQHVERRFGDIGRDSIRTQSVLQALALLREVAGA